MYNQYQGGKYKNPLEQAKEDYEKIKKDKEWFDFKANEKVAELLKQRQELDDKLKLINSYGNKYGYSILDTANYATQIKEIERQLKRNKPLLELYKKNGVNIQNATDFKQVAKIDLPKLQYKHNDYDDDEYEVIEYDEPSQLQITYPQPDIIYQQPEINQPQITYEPEPLNIENYIINDVLPGEVAIKPEEEEIKELNPELKKKKKIKKPKKEELTIPYLSEYKKFVSNQIKKGQIIEYITGIINYTKNILKSYMESNIGQKEDILKAIIKEFNSVVIGAQGKILLKYYDDSDITANKNNVLYELDKMLKTLDNNAKSSRNMVSFKLIVPPISMSGKGYATAHKTNPIYSYYSYYF